MKWVVFATAPDQIMAEIWVQLVRAEGIPCRLQPGDTTNFLGVSAAPVRLMTLGIGGGAGRRRRWNAGMRWMTSPRAVSPNSSFTDPDRG